MAMYRPSQPFTTPLRLLTPTYTVAGGVRKKTYPAVESGLLFFGSFKTYGGTELTSNGLYVVEDTATIETWYMPEITGECRIAIAGTNKVYEVVGEPENIDMRNQFSQFKVKRVTGGA